MQLQETGFQYRPEVRQAALAESSEQTQRHSCSMKVCAGLHSEAPVAQPQEQDTCSSTLATAHSEGVAPALDEWRTIRTSTDLFLAVAGRQSWYLQGNKEGPSLSTAGYRRRKKFEAFVASHH